MNKNELWRLLVTTENRFEKEKTKRTIFTVLGFSIAYCVLFLLTDKASDQGILGAVLAGLFAGGVHFWINTLVFGWLFRSSEQENKALENLREQLREAEAQERSL